MLRKYSVARQHAFHVHPAPLADEPCPSRAETSDSHAHGPHVRNAALTLPVFSTESVRNDTRNNIEQAAQPTVLASPLLSVQTLVGNSARSNNKNLAHNIGASSGLPFDGPGAELRPSAHPLFSLQTLYGNPSNCVTGSNVWPHDRHGNGSRGSAHSLPSVETLYAYQGNSSNTTVLLGSNLPNAEVSATVRLPAMSVELS